jgi:toxin ParE1/3/4
VTPLLLRPRAVRDLGQIWTWTAERWGSARAERYISSIRDTCAPLASGEISGTDASDLRPGYRRIRSGRHLIFFRPAADGAIEVVRILHERMDVTTRLRDG